MLYSNLLAFFGTGSGSIFVCPEEQVKLLVILHGALGHPKYGNEMLLYKYATYSLPRWVLKWWIFGRISDDDPYPRHGGGSHVPLVIWATMLSATMPMLIVAVAGHSLCITW
ncbi:hypothetical protein AVEN_55559-1 [Araneus ventricosus]|uniref:Uncharacterized protein n=1 Tax=Araneus ventricosus TaxID=182803 RepID=A0A4Y2FWE3_ARAVE|nr:hypothetical protein AVEN_55559-1 [Araneus ventricosus]